MEEYQPWVTCFLTHILVSYAEEAVKERGIDYASLFRDAEGFETPSDPRAFLQDFNNWVPLVVLRDLLSQCERVSGRKDVAYLAARAFFDPARKQLPSLFEIIVRVLDDVGSTLISSTLWGAVQTNYLKLQGFGGQDTGRDLYMLAQFHPNARPTPGTINLLRGIGEGFPRLYPFVDDVRCIEEVSQLQIGDILREFPDFCVESEGDRLSIHHRNSQGSRIEAIRVPLKAELVSLSRDFIANTPDAVVIMPQNGRMHVITNQVEADSSRVSQSPRAFKIVRAGEISQGRLTYQFEEDQIYNAPYCRFRFVYQEKQRPQTAVSRQTIRREISQLLFGHLKQSSRTQMRIIQYNIDKRRLTLENSRLRKEIEREYSFQGIVGESQKMHDTFAAVRSVAETDMTVIIQGETGTGKELIARGIHYNSVYRNRRFVAVNCAALPETLLESELFGHEKGAFTGATTARKGIFESADGGTLFLDEIGEIPPSTQVKLLRILQEGEFQRVGASDTRKVNVRIIAATNQDLEDLVRKGSFRKDLYFRLNVFPIRVPPLRERSEDVPLLVSHFIQKNEQKVRKRFLRVSPQAMALLTTYSWPGNIRELENVIQRMMVVAKGETLELEDLPPQIRGMAVEPRDGAKDLREMVRESAELVERRVILDALAKAGGNVTHTARLLGISRATLQSKMKSFGLQASRSSRK